MKTAVPISISVGPSRQLFVVQAVAHAVAAGAVLAAGLPTLPTLALVVLVAASVAWTSRVAGAKDLVLGGDGGLRIVGADGTAIDVSVHPHTVVLNSLVVLLYRQQGRLRSLVLLANSASAEDFRQLRMWLRWRASSKLADSPQP